MRKIKRRWGRWRERNCIGPALKAIRHRSYQHGNLDFISKLANKVAKRYANAGALKPVYKYARCRYLPHTRNHGNHSATHARIIKICLCVLYCFFAVGNMWRNVKQPLLHRLHHQASDSIQFRWFHFADNKKAKKILSACWVISALELRDYSSIHWNFVFNVKNEYAYTHVHILSYVVYKYIDMHYWALTCRRPYSIHWCKNTLIRT